MNRFPPYTIHHIDLHDSMAMPDINVEEKGNYLVFWWNSIGLGQFFIEPNESLSENDYYRKLAEVITPTIIFYLEDQTIAGASEWEAWLENSMYDEFHRFMDLALARFNAEKMPAIVPISVIICTRNRASYLQQCLYTLKKMVCLAGEIVVVDNAPIDDSTKKIVEGFEGVKYVAEPRPGLDIARNAGIANAIFPVVAYIDDDVCVHPTWAYNVWLAFRDPAIGAMTGLVIAAELETEAQLIFEKFWSFNRGYTDKVYDSNYFQALLKKGPPVWEIGAGANMAFRKSVFATTGCFNELLDAGASGCNGDSEMWFRVLTGGYSICYNPRAIVTHEHRKDLKGLKKQLFAYMRGFVTAALLQQKQVPQAGYVNDKLRSFPSYYLDLIKKGYPKFNSRYQTLGNELRGVFAGFLFFFKNRKLILAPVPAMPVNKTPLVSIIIPSYNHAPYLLSAINSIRLQDYIPIEIIVVDDGSTDNTQELLKDIEGVKNIYQKNQGLSAARNTGIKNSSGEFLLFLDADDWLLPGSIAFNLSYMLADKNLAFVSGAHEKVFVDRGESVDCSQEVNSEHYFHFLHGNYIGMHGTVMFRRWVFDDLLFDESLKACEDYDVYLKAARKFPVVHHTHKIAAYRIHGNNMSGNSQIMLSSVVKVLKRQKEGLQTAEEQNAYKTGLKTWKDYYNSILPPVLPE